MSSIRLALVGALVVVTFVGAQVAGLAAASYDQKTESANAQAAISTAARAFDIEAQRVVADGTHEQLLATSGLYAEILAQTIVEDL